MSNTNPTYAPKCTVIQNITYAEVQIPRVLWPAFQQLIQRGAQTWSDAPPAMKELADMVTNGQVLQNYWDQNKDLQKKSD